MSLRMGLSFDDVLIVPEFSTVASRSNCDVSSKMKAGDKFVHLQIPLISANMDTVTEGAMAATMAYNGGLGIIHRNMYAAKQVKKVKFLADDGLAVGAAVGVKDYDRIDALVDAGVSSIVFDIAHGHSQHALHTIEYIANKYADNVWIVAGNVATGKAVFSMASAGAHAVKVGIGPGAACSTRVMTGVGVPQVTAIMDCAEAAKFADVSIIADGGIRNPGDLAKAFAAGADVVMIGSLFAGTDEAPGEVIELDGEKVKAYRGMASTEASGREHAEGVSGFVPYRGSVKEVINYLMGGLRSAMSYVGAHTLPEFKEKAQLIGVTPHGVIESAPHDIRVK